MNALRQIAAATAMSLRTIPERLGGSLVIVVGMAAVVAVVISVLSMSTSFLDSVHRASNPDRAIVTTASSVNQTTSRLSRDAVSLVMQSPGVKKGADGKPIASAELFTNLPLTKTGDGGAGNVPLHGAQPEAFVVVPEIRIVEGRMFKPGLRELIVGRLAQPQFYGLNIGDKVTLPDGKWEIVGVFESNQGDTRESDLKGDAETIMSAYRRSDFNSVTVRLESAAAFDTFRDALTANPALAVDVMREDAYFEKLAKPLNDYLELIAYAVGSIMALGAMFGALNTMYSAVSARTREIATLRALGFGSAAVMISVLIEALLLSLLGAMIGAGLAWLFFDGRVAVSGWAVFMLSIGPPLLALGVAWAVGIGLIGGFFAALRAVRLPIVSALRAT